MDSFKKIQENSLPVFGSNWINSLPGKTDVLPAVLKFANCVWENFNCRDKGDYDDIFLKTDVLLLSDIFENFPNLLIWTPFTITAHQTSHGMQCRNHWSRVRAFVRY